IAQRWKSRGAAPVLPSPLRGGAGVGVAALARPQRLNGQVGGTAPPPCIPPLKGPQGEGAPAPRHFAEVQPAFTETAALSPPKASARRRFARCSFSCRRAAAPPAAAAAAAGLPRAAP